MEPSLHRIAAPLDTSPNRDGLMRAPLSVEYPIEDSVATDEDRVARLHLRSILGESLSYHQKKIDEHLAPRLPPQTNEPRTNDVPQCTDLPWSQGPETHTYLHKTREGFTSNTAQQGIGSRAG